MTTERNQHPLFQLFLARVRQFFREPETIFWVYFFPLIMMAVLGIAFRQDRPVETSIRVLATDETEFTRLSTVLSAGGVRVERITTEELDSPTGVHDFDLTLIARGGNVEYQLDPQRAESREARHRVDNLLQEAAGRTNPVSTMDRRLQAPGTRYVDWLVPGLMGLNIMGGGFWGVGFAAVDLRIRRILKKFRVTPMRRTHFMLSLVGGRLLFLIPEMASILLVGKLAFGLEIQGNILSIFFVSLVGATSFASLGLLIASRAQKLETISGLINLCMMPMWITSGVFFSAKRFPDEMQWLVQSLPLTQLINSLRGVILEGQSLLEIGPSIGVVALWGVISLPLALRLFRWH